MADLWMRATCSRYNAMKSRPIVKKLGGLRFSLDEFRYHVLKFFGTRDGVGRCRYCGRYVTFESSATDHAMPLKRGGSTGRENLEFPCPTCNRIKGGLTPEEMLNYMLWKSLLPIEAQNDLDERLSKAVQALTSMGRFQRSKIRKASVMQLNSTERVKEQCEAAHSGGACSLKSEYIGEKRYSIPVGTQRPTVDLATTGGCLIRADLPPYPNNVAETRRDECQVHTKMLSTRAIRWQWRNVRPGSLSVATSLPQNARSSKT